MFGLFKKPITPAEFGQGLLQLSGDWIASDAGRSLGVHFPNFDGSEGWGVFLERRGMGVPLQKLHYCIYTHCALQAISTLFEEDTAWGITSGAIRSFTGGIDGYDFDVTYAALARIMHDGVRSGTPDGGRMSSGRLAWAV